IFPAPCGKHVSQSKRQLNQKHQRIAVALTQMCLCQTSQVLILSCRLDLAASDLYWSLLKLSPMSGMQAHTRQQSHRGTTAILSRSLPVTMGVARTIRNHCQ